MSSSAVADYVVVPLGPRAVASDINNRPQVVGYILDGANQAWATVCGAHSLGIRVDPDRGLRINDAGIVVGFRIGDGHSRLFAWVNGVIIDLPPPPGDIPQRVRILKNTNVLLVQGLGSSWQFAQGTDLNAVTGAQILGLNEAGVLAGRTGDAGSSRPYLRYPDGHQVDTVTSGSVTLVGSGGHFVIPTTTNVYWYGRPDGTVSVAGPQSALYLYAILGDINSSGHVVGCSRRRGFATVFHAWIDRHDGVDVQWLPLDINCAVAVNDAGYIVGSGRDGGVVLVPRAPGPSGLVFSVAGRTVTLSWTEVAGASEYLIEAGRSAGAADLYVASVGASLSLVVSAPPGRYYVRVRARSGSISAPSNEVVVDVF